MQINLIGKTALVGGASGGIGKAIALELARCGARVFLMARNEDKLKLALQDLSTDAGQQHGYLLSDFNDYQKHKAVLSSFFETHSIDILVNNTNGPTAGDLSGKGEDDYQQAFELLFQNAVFASNLAIPHMRRAGYGRIINVSSMTVKEPQDGLVLSNTMRTALVSWSKSLANAVGKDQITVNSILTGYFETDRLKSLMERQAEQEGLSMADVKQQRADSIPVKRLGKPEEYGYLVSFLASPFAAFLTGAAIPLDGGLSKTLY